MAGQVRAGRAAAVKIADRAVATARVMVAARIVVTKAGATIFAASPR